MKREIIERIKDHIRFELTTGIDTNNIKNLIQDEYPNQESNEIIEKIDNILYRLEKALG